MHAQREYAETASSKIITGRRGSIVGVQEVLTIIPARAIDTLQAVVLSVLLGLTLLQGPAVAMAADAAGRTGDGVLSAEPGSHVSHHRTTADVMDYGEDWLTAVRNYIMRLEYHASESATGLQAPSRRHGFRTYFEPTGIRVVDRVASGSQQLLALRLEQIGRADTLTAVTPGEIISDGNRVEIRRGSILEW